eukprot:CAMPEP_0170512002 /NCGR_PEP_ID=MMETSP0208-20121228/66611_1 /TAXON_ID=197538 /ORGANISM="Strombidium inclinatum, Strain S3" /LENGTH=94 /DNA_ID=CAMNT_0010795591 /DNA_START=86 /DNA_END=370 /DNA_ORIENTATION=+
MKLRQTDSTRNLPVSAEGGGSRTKLEPLITNDQIVKKPDIPKPAAPSSKQSSIPPLASSSQPDGAMSSSESSKPDLKKPPTFLDIPSSTEPPPA